MAKKQTFTVGSKDNMRSRLQELKDYTFNPLTGINPSEEQYEFDMAQTKPLNTSSLEETPKQEKNVTTEDASTTKSGKGPNYIADPVFSFINGIQQDMVDRPTGDMLLNNKEKDELEFQKVFLETEKEMKLLDQQLNRAYLDKDTDKVHELYPQYKATFDAYSSMLDEYKKVASKYYSQYGYQPTVEERLQALNEGISEREQKSKELGEDIQRGRDILHFTNSIYSISDEWKQLEQENWAYQVPRALGTSFSSIQATAANFAAIAAANYLAAQVAASPTGPYSPLIAGGAALIGAGVTVGTNIWSRDRESLSEVANNYKQNVYEYANKNNIDINSLADIGRENLSRITGVEYSNDKNSSNYRSNDEVFEDMLAYDIPTGNNELDALRYTTKNNLKDIYNRNMALAASDVAQAATIIPGAGKVFTKVLGKLNLPERAIDGTVKVLDKAIDYTTKKVAPKMSKVAKHRLSKYVLEPTVRISANAALEGIEEVTQYMIGNRINEQNISDTNLYNPLDVATMFMENNAMALKGLAAVAGISGDPALDGNKELVDNFKVGAAIGLLMGGGTTAVSTANNLRSYNAGTELSRNLMAEHISAKEDIYKYIQYANKADKRMLNKEAFLDAIDQQIESANIPDGWTKEDLESEKRNISSIYDIVKNNSKVREFKGEDRHIAAAIYKHKTDMYNKAISDYETQIKDIAQSYNSINSEIDNVLSSLSDDNTDSENTLLLKAYLLDKARLEGIKNYIKVLEESQIVDKNKLDEFYIAEKGIERRLSGLSDIKDKFSVNPDDIVLSSRDDIESNAVKSLLAEIALTDAKQSYKKFINSDKALNKAVDIYKNSITEDTINQDEQIQEEETPQQEPANIDEEDTSDTITLQDSIDKAQQQADKIQELINQQSSILEQTQQQLTGETEEEEKAVTQPTQVTSEQPVQEEEKEVISPKSFWELGTTVDTNEDYEGLVEEELTEEDLINPNETISEDNTNNVADNPEATVDQNASDYEGTQSAEDIPSVQEQPLMQTEEIIPQTHTVTSNTEQPSAPITEQDVEDSKVYDTDDVQINDEEPTELVYGTLYYQPDNDQPMFKGYESGRSLNEYLSTPGMLAESKVTAKIGPKDSKFGSYDPANKATWDEAPIYIEIEAKDGRKFMATLKTIEGAKGIYRTHGRELSKSEEDRIRELRNQIIEAKINDPNCEITFKNITITNGNFNVNRTEEGEVINRNLLDIESLGVRDLHNILDSETKFGIGKGVADHFIIMDRNGLPMEGKGGSGKIFVYPPAQNTPAGVTRNIKLNEARFSTEDNSPSELARYLANVILYRQTGNEAVYPEDVIQLVVNYGNSTILDPSDPRYAFLADKQFFVNYKEGWAQLGREQVLLSKLRTDAGFEDLVEFITDNLHWNTEKNLLWEPLPKSFREAMIDDNVDHLELVPGLEFDLEDVGLKRINGKLITDEDNPKGLTTLAYLIKHGKLLSDLQDRLFTRPYVYIDSPVISSKPTEQQKKLEAESQSPTKKKFSLYEVPTFDAGEELSSKTEDKSYDEFTDVDSDAVSSFLGLDGAPKILNSNQLKQSKFINTKKAKKWLQKKLGLTDEQVEVTDGVIREFANGSAVYGIARADGIAISNKAIEGVQYHEAWHRVSLLMLDRDTRNKLYDEFRKQNNQYSNLDNKQLEEVIADRFMDYMLNDKESTLRYYINKIFRNIKKFLHINSNIDPTNLNKIFDAIKYGDFSNYQLNEESLKDFLDSYTDGAYYKVGPNKDITLKHFPTLQDFHSALDSLKACLFIANGAKYISDVQDLDNTKLKDLLQSFIKSNRTTTAQKEALQEIVDNFDAFMYHLQPMLEQMGIRPINQNMDEEFLDRESNGMQNYDKAGYEFDKKNNALASAKMFFATLSDTYFSYKDVSGVKARTLSTRINTITGLPMIVNYDTAYALILKNLSTVESFSTEPGQDPETSLLGRCARLAKGNAFFAFLYKRLNGDIDINLQTQILQTVKSFDQNFVEVHYQQTEQGTSFVVDDGINKRATKMYPSTWSDLFFNSSLVERTETETKPNKSEINAVISRFNELYKQVEDNRNTITNTDVDTYINELVNILNSIGITVDHDTIEGLLPNDRPYGISKLILGNEAGALKYLFNGTLQNLIDNKTKYTNKKGIATVRQLDQIYMNLGKNSFINTLAQAQAVTHPSDTEISVLGPNNNIIFTKTLNCFVSDQVRWLNNHDDATLKDLNADTYCRSSLILSAVNNNSPIRLNTFVNFYGENRGDKGRDYLSISPVEDYLAKMTFTYNNHIIFPTMADKKTWFTISGVGLFNKEMSITQVGNSLKLQFNREALKHLYRSWEDEYNTIVEYYNSLPDVKKPIKNYHTSGKGGLFRHFTGYYTKIDGQLKWIDLNERIKNSVKEGNIIQTLEEIKQELFTTPKDTFQKINDNLHMQLKQEIDTCEKLGIIERDKKNPKVIKNKLLDNVVLNKFKEIYLAHPNNNVSNQAERYAILTMIGNHMINYNISVLETEKIFTGDVAFFKNDDDKIKRLGAVLSTGDNLRTQWYTSVDKNIKEYRRLQNRQTYTNTTINDNEIPSRQHKELEDLFTFSNTRKLLIEKEGLTESQVDELMKDPKSAEEKYPIIFQLAKDLAVEDASAYGMNKKGTKGNINQADAAVYIRPQMYRDIVKMLGEWSDEIEEAFNIMESDADWLNDAELYAKSLKTLIKPLKTTYFGYTYDANLKHCIPVFNKMAMFPMFKVLATGDNREIYDRMNAIGKYQGLTPIDQVAFESAVKVGIQGATDIYKDYKNDEINDLSNMHITTQKFRNLRRQLITDPHTRDRTLFGTQVSTVAVSNLVMNRVYQEGTDNEITGQQIKEQLFGTINAISNKGFKEVKDMFLSNNTLDYVKASKQLIKEARASNMGKDIEEALEVNQDGTDFKVPLSALPDSKWVETKLTSTTNKKAIDLELPGGAFIQMSSFGFKSIKAVGSRAINNGKPLLNINKDGSMDSIISINLFSHIIPDYKNKSFVEARDWLIKHKIVGQEAGPMAMGYRIPTQGLSSIAGLRIVDVLPSVVGDTIILPDEFTTQTGSDFDIDKLYIARYNFDEEGNKIEFKKQKSNETFEAYLRRRYTEEQGGELEESARGYSATYTLYNRWLESIGSPTNVYEANSREANENLLLDTYLAVLTDKKNVDETRLPLDKVTGIIKEEILPIVDGQGKLGDRIPFRELSPTYQMNKKYEYSGGKTGIGPFALNNKNHVLTQLANLKFSDISLLQRLGFVGLDGIKSRNEIVYQRDEKGNILLDEQGNPIKIQEEGLRILDWISAMINAHVDVAKDPYVIRLNVRQYTYNICNFLLRVGYGKDTFYFLPQQILKDMASAYDRASGIYGVDDSKSKTAIVKDEITTIRKSYYDKYKKAATELGIKKLDLEMSKTGDIVMQKLDSEGRSIGLYSIEDFATDITDRDFLIQQLQLSQKDNLTNEEAYNYYKNQILISELFIQLNDLAQDMSKLVQLSQVDTKRFGGNFIEQDRFLYRLKSLIANSTLFNKDDILNYLNSTFLMTKINNSIVGPSDMFSNIMIRGKRDFKSAISQVLTMINRIDTNDESLNKTISNELEGSLRYSFLNQEGIDLYDMFYGTDTMAKRLSKIKADILAGKYPEMLTQDGKIGNQLLNYLGTLTKMSTDKYNAPDIIIKNRISDDDKYLKQNLNQYWEELLESDYPEIKQFAQDLIRYQLATTAGNFTKNGIFNLLPTSAIQSTGYADYMRSVTERFNVTDLDFDNFFLNNWTNNKIVKPVQLYKKVFSSETDKVEDQLQFPVLFSENKNHSGSKYPVMMIPNYRPVGRNESKQNVYTPYIKVKLAYDNNPANTILYKYIGNVFDDKYQERPVYVMTNKKGLNQEGRVVKEYDNYSNSMFEFNNIDGALDAKSAFSVDDIKNIINLGNKMNRSKWINIINNIELVRDYKPVTVALKTSIEELQSAPTRNHASIAPTSIALETVEYKPSTVNIIGDHITFRNGKVVNTPFKLNQQQEHALLVLEDFINNPNKYDNSVTLSGYAGTGKTSIISIFNKYLNSIGIEPLFSAPTHRANAVTKMNNPESQVITLHSAFGLSPIVDLDSGNYDLKKLKTEQIRKPKIKPGQLLIIDEASMVSKGLYNFVEDFKKENNVQVIYIGDPAQLSPVSDNTISPVFQDKATNVELTKVERTGDNPILEEATNLRNGKSLSFTTKLVNGFGVEYMHDGEQPNQIIKDIVSSNEYKTNPFNFRILSATNAMIPTVNDMIRKQLYGDNPNQIEVGDLLMGYDNVTMNDGEAQAEIIRNSIDYKVASVSNKINKQIVSVINGSVIAEVEGYEVTLVNAMDNETVSDKVFVLDNNTSTQNLKAIANEIESINKMISKAFMSRDFNTVRIAQKALSVIKMNTITMKDYQENGRLKIRKSIDYGYAHTIHKSQGGTYDKVMIYYDTITGAKFDTDTQQQLKYVAVSRARENVYIVTDNKLNDPVIVDTAKVQPIDYVNHSGGAQGSDSVWGEIGEKYGVISKHYYTGETSQYNAPAGNTEISNEDYEEGRYKVAQAAKANYGYQYSTMKDPRLIRNWAQVKYSDAVFAIGNMVNKGQKLFPNKKNDTRLASHVAVTGGTGYAVEMAIQAGKPVYVFDQKRLQWYKNIDGNWSKSDTPALTNNFAGIGTREINEYGRQAIEDVYRVTFPKERTTRDINNTDNTNNDPVNFNNTETSKAIISSDKTMKDNPLTRTTNELIDAKQLSFNDVNTKLFNLCNKLGIKTVLVDSSQLVSETNAAQYDSDNNRILLNNNYEQLLDKMDSTLDQIISHEYIHVISAYAIDNVEDMPEQVQDAVKIIEASYQQLLNSEKQNYIEMFGKIIPNDNTYYGLIDEKEMLAELANPNFRKILRKHNLLNNLINSIKNIIVSLFKKYKISSNSTIEDNLINSLNTLIDNFDLSVYNNWNEERTYLRWYRNNIISFNFNKYVGKKVYESVTTQLKSKSADQLATFTINLPIGVAEELYNTIGGKDGKNKPVNFRFENRLMLPVRILSMRESDKMFDGFFGPVKSYDVTVETHPTIIPQQEYKKAGNQYKHLQYITENANIISKLTELGKQRKNECNG